MGQLNILDVPYSTRIGAIEILRMQDIQQKTRTGVLTPFVAQAGLKIGFDSNGEPLTDWEIPVAGIGQRYFNVNSGRGVIYDSDGALHGVSFPTTQFDSQAIGDGTFKMILRYASTAVEAGTVAVTNGSGSVVGTGTEFTKIFAPGRSLIVAGVAYTIQSVTNDNNLALAAVFNGATDASAIFSVGGMFVSNPAVAQMGLYSYDGYSIVFTSGSVQAGDVYFYDVTITSGLLSAVTDKRSANLFSLAANSGAYVPVGNFGQIIFDNRKAMTKIQFYADSQGNNFAGIKYDTNNNLNVANWGAASILSYYDAQGNGPYSQVSVGATGIILNAQNGVMIQGTGAVLGFPGAGSVAVTTTPNPLMLFEGVGTVGLRASLAQLNLTTAGVMTLSDSTGLNTVFSVQGGSMMTMGQLTINPTGDYNANDPSTFFTTLMLGQYVSFATVNSNPSAGGIIRLSAIGSAAGIRIGVANGGALPSPNYSSYISIGLGDIDIMSAMLIISNNVVIGGGGATSTFGGGNNVVAIKTTSTPPTSSDATAGLIWVAADGSLKYRSTGGTITTLGAA